MGAVYEFPVFNDPGFEDVDPQIRSAYALSLVEIKRKYSDFTQYLNRVNPYTGRRITTEAEFEEYLREHSIRLAYEKVYQKSAVNLDSLLSSKDARIKRLEKENQELSTQKDRLQTEVERQRHSSVSKRPSLILVSACLSLALIVSLFIVMPHSRDSAYENGKSYGYSEGYSAGHDAGEKSGYTDGYSAGERSGYSNGYSSGQNSSTGDSSNGGQSSSGLAGISPPTFTTQERYTVYVSNNGLIHKRSNCSGMKHYTEMTYADAVAAGHRLCSKCY